MLVKNVVASMAPKVATQEKTAQEQKAGDFRSVLDAAAAGEAKASEETVQPDAAGQADVAPKAESSDSDCSGCRKEKGADPIVGTAESSEASATKSGGYAIFFSWYVRVADDVGKVESPAVRLFHDVAERISDVFLNGSGWRGNPVQALLAGTESVVRNDAGQVGSYLGSLLESAKSGLQSLVQSLNNGPFWPGSTSSSSASRSAFSSVADTAFDTSYMTNIALAKLQYGGRSGNGISGNLSGLGSLSGLGGSVSSIVSELMSGSGLTPGSSMTKPLPRNVMGGQIVMISNKKETASSETSPDIGTDEAARRFLEAFKVFVASMKREESQKLAAETETKTDAESDAAKDGAPEEAQDAPADTITA